MQYNLPFGALSAIGVSIIEKRLGHPDIAESIVQSGFDRIAIKTCYLSV
jgi:hypothetical protein